MDVNFNDPPDVFWHHVFEMKTREESPPFFNLARFMLEMLSVPHSNADCERIFSHIILEDEEKESVVHKMYCWESDHATGY